jgi:hypothetical protein
VTKKKIQIVIIILGLICYGLGFLTILQVPTMFMTPTYLALVLTVPTLIVSLLLGLLTKFGTGSKWHWLTFTFIYLGLISLTVFALEYKDYENVKVIVDENKSGHYFIVATTDKNKAINYTRQSINFDSNNVIYLDSGLYKKAVIKPINNDGKDLSKRIKTHMGNQYYQHFYNPNNDEYKLHPEWSTYYHKYQYPLELDKQRLEKLGYIFKDSLLKIDERFAH